MELVLLLVVAGVTGFLLSRSNLSKPIDETTEKVAGATRKAADNAENWITRTLRREKKPEAEVIEVEAKTDGSVQPAARQPSRRRGEDESTEAEE